jgi:hypothetical protein
MTFKSYKTLLSVWCLFLLLGIGTLSAQTVAGGFAFSQQSGTYTPITGGTVLGTGSIDDTNYANQAIGFTFNYNGVAYTAFSVNANGFIALGTTIASSYTSLSTGTTNNVIAALNYDMQSQANGDLRFQVLGAAPNRQLVVQYSNWASYQAINNPTENFNFQIVLEETTNKISVNYGNFIVNATSKTAQVGLRGAAATDFNNRTTTNNWAATTAGATNAAACTFNNTSFPASGLSFVWTPIQITAANVTLTPAGASCAATARTVTVDVTAVPDATSVVANYTINGVAQPGVAMALTAGTAGSGTWAGTIPAATGAGVLTVAYNFTITNAAGQTGGPFAGGSYIENYLGVNAGADQILGVGLTTTLNASANDPSLFPVLISEITHFETGTGATAPYPAFVPTATTDWDGIEISNIHATNPVNIGGLIINIWTSATAQTNYTIPANTIIPGGGVAVFGYNNTASDPANRYFSMGGITAQPSSASNYGYILKTATGAIIDAVGTGTFAFPAASGVTAANWSGNIPSSSGRAGVVRVGPTDTNVAANWAISNTVAAGGPIQTIGSANPQITLINTTAGAFNWMPGMLTGQSITVGPFTPGTYTYTVTYSDGTCTQSDAVTILVPNCPAPTAFAVSGVIDTAATFNWISGGGAVDSTIIEYGPVGFAQGSGTRVVVSGNPATLTSFLPNTTYQAYVFESCDPVSGNSFYSAPVTFTTLCSPNPYPGNTTAAPLVVGSFPYSYTVNANEWACYTNNNTNRASQDVFFRFTVDSCATQATVSLCSTAVAWDTYLTILAADGTTTVVTADDVCAAHASATFNVQPGATYYAMVEPYATTGVPTNPFTVNISQTLGVPNPAFTLATVQPTCATATNGSVSVNLTNINKAPIGYTWSTGATTASISGLGVGMYYVTVTNGCGGSKVDSVQLNSSFAVALTSQTNVSCAGGNNGAVNITVTGGVAPYAFAWSNGATTEDLAGLVAGAYTGTVTDAALCQLSATATITQPAPITIAINDIDNVSCNGGANGAIDLTVNGGVNLPPVPGQLTTLFAQNNGCGAGNMFDLTVNSALELTGFDLSMGTVTGAVTIFYKTGSYIGSETTPGAWTQIYTGTLTGAGNNLPTPLSLASPLALAAGNYAFYVQADLDYTNIAAGTTYSNTAMTLTVGAGFCTAFSGPIAGRAWNGNVKYQTPGAGFSYLWSNGATTEDAAGLAAGTYTMTVTDGNGCVYYTPSIPVTQPAALALGAASTTNVSCAGGNNGAQNITVTGGTLPYTYAWSNGATTRNLTGLTAGTYNGIATDANGCTIAYGPYTVTAPAPLAVAVDAATGATCNGGTDASLTITVSGGTAPYSFNWSNGATTEDLAAVAAGAYTGTITDTRGCVLVAGPVTLTQPTAIAATVDATANVLCAGGTDGLISISVAGGTAPYTYTWSNGSTDEDLTGLGAGAYTGTITDAAGCTLVAGPVTITEPAGLGIGATFADVSCFGDSTGVINIAVSGGTAPYTYNWSNGSTDEDLSGVPAGSYSGTITDANGCQLVAGPVTIAEPAAAVAVMVDTIVQIAGCAGDATGEISITVSGGTAPYTFNWSNGSTDEDLMMLAAGAYTGTITDANGCVLVAGPVTITEPTAVAVTAAVVTDVACFGDASGGIDISVAGGTAPYSFNWSNGATTEDLSAVAAGDYTGSITDSNGCLLVAGPVTVAQPAAALAIGGVTLTPISCNGANDGGVDVVIVGGTTPYTYLWSNGSTDASISGLGAGIYSGTVTDANGCTLVGGPAPISQPDALTATATATQPSAAGVNDGAITTTVTGGTAPFSYSWSNGATTAGLTGLGAGAYGVAIVDANGCLTTAAANILDLTSIVDAEGVNVFEIFPNPANEVVNIRMELAEAQDVNLELYSVDGKLVDAQAFGRTLTMNYRLDVSRLANGVYMAKVLVGTQVIVQRVVVTK